MRRIVTPSRTRFKGILTPEQIRGHVFTAMGVASREELARATRVDIQKHFAPNAKRAYPSNAESDRSRVAMEYGTKQWGHLGFLRESFKHDAKIAQALKISPAARVEFEKALFDAIQERALKAYSEEWRSLSPKAITALIGRSKMHNIRPPPTVANEFNANLAARELIRRLKTEKIVTIVDLGCGGGNTIAPIIDRIPLELRRKVRVVLVDVMRNGLRSTQRKLMQKGLIGKEQVITISENLARLNTSGKLAQLYGEADIVTSGAALHHVAAIEPTFEGVKKLLKKGGSFIFWDWGHSAWKAPNLIIAPERAQVDKYGQSYEFRGRTRQAEKGTAFVSQQEIPGVTALRKRPKASLLRTHESIPTEDHAVFTMLSTWISLLNYSHEDRMNFMQWFNERSQKGAPINFSEYLKRLEGRPLEEGKGFAEIKYWEGHRPPELYHDAMRRVGLISPEVKPFTIYSTNSPLLYQMKVVKE